MEWFEITSDGLQQPFKDLIRPDYKEPKTPIDLIEEFDKGKNSKTLPELMAQLDCYVGHVDGYAYSSLERLKKMRTKGVFKPVGPLDMYNYPGTCSMDCGWWQRDPALKNQTWFHPVVGFNKVNSDVTNYFNEALRIDPTFRF